MKGVTILAHEGAPRLGDVDTIEYEGKFWLVPEWNDTQDGEWTKPTRIICLEGLPFEKSNLGGTLLSGAIALP